MPHKVRQCVVCRGQFNINGGPGGNGAAKTCSIVCQKIRIQITKLANIEKTREIQQAHKAKIRMLANTIRNILQHTTKKVKKVNDNNLRNLEKKQAYMQYYRQTYRLKNLEKIREKGRAIQANNQMLANVAKAILQQGENL